MNAALWRRVALGGLLASIGSLWLWQLWLAPYRGGLVLAAVLSALALPALPGMWRGRPYTHAWASLLATGYLAFGMMEAYAEPAARGAATLLMCAAAAWFVGCNLYVRASRSATPASPRTPDQPPR